VRSPAVVRLAALIVAVGFAGLAVFQLALSAGAPLGRAAWGGMSTQLPMSLRLASVVAIFIYGLEPCLCCDVPASPYGGFHQDLPVGGPGLWSSF
jgi:hypothetical protein